MASPEAGRCRTAVGRDQVSGYTAVEIVFPELILRVEHNFKGGRKLYALKSDPLAEKHKEARGANPMRPGQTFLCNVPTQ